MTKKGKAKVVINVEDFPVVHEVGSFVTVSLAAEMLGIKRNAIYHLIRTGKLKGVHLAELVWLVRRSSVERLIRERSGGGDA